MGKTNPLNEQDLEEFIDLQRDLTDSALSWSVDISEISQQTWDLSIKNPNGTDQVIHQSPIEIIAEIESLNLENQAILNRMKELL